MRRRRNKNKTFKDIEHNPKGTQKVKPMFPARFRSQKTGGKNPKAEAPPRRRKHKQ